MTGDAPDKGAGWPVDRRDPLDAMGKRAGTSLLVLGPVFTRSDFSPLRHAADLQNLNPLSILRSV
jgi:hypothetical protein